MRETITSSILHDVPCPSRSSEGRRHFRMSTLLNKSQDAKSRRPIDVRAFSKGTGLMYVVDAKGCFPSVRRLAVYFPLGRRASINMEKI